MAWPKLRVKVRIKPPEATLVLLIHNIMGKLLHCPCVNEKYCGTMIQSTKLHRVMYDSAFHKFIHSKKGLDYLLSNFGGKIEIVSAIKDAYIKLK